MKKLILTLPFCIFGSTFSMDSSHEAIPKTIPIESCDDSSPKKCDSLLTIHNGRLKLMFMDSAQAWENLLKEKPKGERRKFLGKHISNIKETEDMLVIFLYACSNTRALKRCLKKKEFKDFIQSKEMFSSNFFERHFPETKQGVKDILLAAGFAGH